MLPLRTFAANLPENCFLEHDWYRHFDGLQKAGAPEGNAKLEEDKENENEGNKGAHQEDVPIHTKYWSKMIEMSPFSGSAAADPDKPEARAPTTCSAPPIQSALRACLPHLPPALHPVDPDALSRASPEPR